MVRAFSFSGPASLPFIVQIQSLNRFPSKDGSLERNAFSQTAPSIHATKTISILLMRKCFFTKHVKWFSSCTCVATFMRSALKVNPIHFSRFNRNSASASSGVALPLKIFSAANALAVSCAAIIPRFLQVQDGWAARLWHGHVLVRVWRPPQSRFCFRPLGWRFILRPDFPWRSPAESQMEILD
jgi:hypothetical protein